MTFDPAGRREAGRCSWYQPDPRRLAPRPATGRADRRGRALEAQEAEMIAIDTMRANVFRAPQEFTVEEVNRPRPGPGEALIRVTLTTICGTDVHIVKGEYPVRPGLVLGHEPVGVIEELGLRRDRLRGRGARPRRRDHPVRPVRGVPHRPPLAVRPWVRLRGDRRLAVRQHDRRRPGRVPARAIGAGEHGEDPRRRDRRAGRPPGRHRVHRLRRGRVGRRPHRRHRRRVRAGTRSGCAPRPARS